MKGTVIGKLKDVTTTAASLPNATPMAIAAPRMMVPREGHPLLCRCFVASQVGMPRCLEGSVFSGTVAQA